MRLVPDTLKSASDSDVQLASPDAQAAQRFGCTLIKEDTADHGIVGSGSSDTAVRVSPFTGSSAEVPAAVVGQRLRAQSVQRADRRTCSPTREVISS